MIYPNIRQAFNIISYYWVLFFLLFIPIAVISKFVGFPIYKLTVTYGVIEFIVILTIIKRILKKNHLPYSKSKAVNFKPISLLTFFSISLIILGLSTILSEIDNLIRLILPMPAEFFVIYNDFFKANPNYFGSIYALLFVAPIYEELLFRGLILPNFLKQYNVKKSLFFSGILFGLVHLNPWQLFNISIMGIILGWVYVRTRSLTPCIFAHFLNNALPYFFKYFQIEIPGYTTEMSKSIFFQPIWFDVAGLVLAIFGIWLFIRLTNNQEISTEDNSLAAISGIKESHLYI